MTDFPSFFKEVKNSKKIGDKGIECEHALINMPLSCEILRLQGHRVQFYPSARSNRVFPVAAAKAAHYLYFWKKAKAYFGTNFENEKRKMNRKGEGHKFITMSPDLVGDNFLKFVNVKVVKNLTACEPKLNDSLDGGD